ncbi:acetylornithine deacetylase [Rhizobiales bacterium GAS191]|nr:acetylornithine deacetylase [Rhizobiales bacterium GAS113]SED47535.1 acetylornithine deacetylase [Rhizobiales bacterium GAS191]
MMSATELLKELVSINSVNPDLVPGAAGEREIADFCANWFAERGFEVHRLEAHKGRPSVVGIAKGRGGGRSLMFNGHIDTVTLSGYDGDPLRPRIEDGKLFGRGSFDMKSGVAAMMIAAERAAKHNLAGDILVACVADEEYASLGSAEVARHFKADGAIVTEPSHLELTLAHKGFVWFDVIVEGRAAHGSRPELGIDAIAKAGHFLVALEAYGRKLLAAPGHKILRTGSVHASIIKGGEELSSYPAQCRISIERRTIPGETGATVEAELRGLLDSIAQDVPDFRYRLERGLERVPFEAKADEPIVATLRKYATEALGRPPQIRGEPFWTDCAILKEAGIPCLLFGADGAGAHAATEWATTDSVETLARVLERTAIEFCG